LWRPLGNCPVCPPPLKSGPAPASFSTPAHHFAPFSAPLMLCLCSVYAPLIPLMLRSCSAHAPPMLRPCSAHAPPMLRSCSVYAPLMLRSFSVHAPLMLRSCSAHVPLTGSADKGQRHRTACHPAAFSCSWGSSTNKTRLSEVANEVRCSSQAGRRGRD